jgi:hypothetical protein
MSTFDTRKRNLYARLVALGGSLPDDERTWRELGRTVGYTGRSDLAGFFGGRVPSMVRADGQRLLTEAGWRRARGPA